MDKRIKLRVANLGIVERVVPIGMVVEQAVELRCPLQCLPVDVRLGR